MKTKEEEIKKMENSRCSRFRRTRIRMNYLKTIIKMWKFKKRKKKLSSTEKMRALEKEIKEKFNEFENIYGTKVGITNSNNLNPFTWKLQEFIESEEKIYTINPVE